MRALFFIRQAARHRLAAAPRLAALGSLIIGLCLGCQAQLTNDGSSESAIVEGSPTAIGLLDFVNGASVETLDVTVGLDKRAANNIVAHIVGADGKRSTSDDNPLDSIAELDAISYVGATALAKLSAYVAAHGLVPDVVIEGVGLTSAQESAILAAANQATQQQLDIEAKLDARAAAAIVAARPIAGVAPLAEVKYVGKAALLALRQWAPGFVAACNLSLADSANPSAADLTELLALATTLDLPRAEVVTFHVSGCPGALDADHRAALIAALEARIDWRYPIGMRMPLSDQSFVAGSAQYSSYLSWSTQAISDAVSEGSWDPNSSARGAQLYAELPSLAAALSPNGDYLEVRIDFDAEECSSSAIALVDTRTLEIRVVHKLPAC
jgi:hypothetical protein